MQVDIGIVNYNAGQHLRTCVERLLGSSTVGHVYIIDNASDDGSLANVQEKAGCADRLTIIRNDRNYGFARAVNQFLKQTDADYLLILNPDCVAAQDTVSRVYTAMEADPKAGMAGCLLLNPDGTEQRGGRRNIPDPASSLKRIFYGRARAHRGFDLVNTPLPPHVVEVEAISGAFMLVRRAALMDVGPMDEGYFLHCEDLDWCMRFRQKGWKILFVPHATAVHQQGISSRSRPLFVLWHKHRGMWRFYRKFYLLQHSSPFNVLVWLGIWAQFGFLMPAAVCSRLRYRGN